MDRIYLDNAATSPVHPKAVDKMLPYMLNQFGNPSSTHSYGREARMALNTSRNICAKSINAKENEIIFTSGGTESDNLAIYGLVKKYKSTRNHIITTSIEHPAVLNTCKQLENEGFEITYLPVDKEGKISTTNLLKSLKKETILVTIMFANNEVGTIQPIDEIGQILKEHSVYFHTDATQAYGLINIDVKKMGIDLLSTSAHKINGPKGVGFLYIKEGIQLEKSTFGGEQEYRRRSGTENVPGIVGMAEAIKILQKERQDRIHLYNQYKEILLSTFDKNQVKYKLNTPHKNSLPHILNISFKGIDIDSFLVNLDLNGISVSGGSACASGSFVTSHVLVSMFGKDSSRLRSSVRLSFGIGNDIKQIEFVAKKIIEIIGDESSYDTK